MKNVLTKEGFADFCASMPVDEEFNYCDNNHCACAQYAKHLDLSAAWHNRQDGSFWHKIDTLVFRLCLLNNSKGESRFKGTFGTLVAHLRESPDVR